MKSLTQLQILVTIIALSFIVASPAFAGTPDGLGPWADSVFSSSQGLMKNGAAVPAVRSNPEAALGVAENNTDDANFFSLGFGGNIVLEFENGISSGIIFVEATNPDYPDEKATVEVSENGSVWTNAGTVTQDGQVSVPENVNCAKFVRITDISDPNIMPDDIADGYDVDGVQAVGDLCNPQPTPPAPTATPTSSPSTSPSSPGFPNTGVQNCTASNITTVPQVLTANRVSPTSIFVSWGPNAGLNSFVVQYGFQNGNWQFSTNVAGFSTTIGSLPINQPIWVRVAATDGCATGAFGASVLVGNLPNSLSPGFPNTGNPLIPGFPNTGFGSHVNKIYWSFQTGVNTILTFLSKALSIF